jgi:hypothetical protein
MEAMRVRLAAIQAPTTPRRPHRHENRGGCKGWRNLTRDGFASTCWPRWNRLATPLREQPVTVAVGAREQQESSQSILRSHQNRDQDERWIWGEHNDGDI